MSDELSFVDLDGQHVELLPARIVLSMFSAQGPDGGTATNGSNGNGTMGIRIMGYDLMPGGGNGMGMSGNSANGS